MKAISDAQFPIDEHRPLYAELKEIKGYHGIEKCLRCKKNTAEERMLDRFFCSECGFAWEFNMSIALQKEEENK